MTHMKKKHINCKLIIFYNLIFLRAKGSKFLREKQPHTDTDQYHLGKRKQNMHAIFICSVWQLIENKRRPVIANDFVQRTSVEAPQRRQPLDVQLLSLIILIIKFTICRSMWIGWHDQLAHGWYTICFK